MPFMRRDTFSGLVCVFVCVRHQRASTESNNRLIMLSDARAPAAQRVTQSGTHKNDTRENRHTRELQAARFFHPLYFEREYFRLFSLWRA